MKHEKVKILFMFVVLSVLPLQASVCSTYKNRQEYHILQSGNKKIVAVNGVKYFVLPLTYSIFADTKKLISYIYVTIISKWSAL